MKCMECGAAMKTRREDHRLRGLSFVVLKDIVVRECPQCKDVEYSIPRMDELLQRIADMLVRLDRPYTGAEIRFLRKFLGWSGVDFASYAGVEPETVSRWENGATAMGESAQRFLRMCVVHEASIEDYDLHELKKIGHQSTPKEFIARITKNHWTARAA